MKSVCLYHTLTGEGHKENNSMDNFNNLQIWQSNIPSAIEHAIKNKCLTESLVAMSPLGLLLCFILSIINTESKYLIWNYFNIHYPISIRYLKR